MTAFKVHILLDSVGTAGSNMDTDTDMEMGMDTGMEMEEDTGHGQVHGHEAWT
jgi:hypothetical protein